MKAGSRDYRDFLEDKEKVLAAIRVIEVIGEAAKNIPPPIRDRYPDVPWSGLARMRDKLIHVYFGIDIEVVWQTLQDDLPPLQDSMKKIMNDLGDEG